MGFVRLVIKLDSDEYEALRDSAQRDLRGARDQIRYIIRSACLGDVQSPVSNSSEIRLTHAEIEKLKQLSIESGLSVSDVLRNLISSAALQAQVGVNNLAGGCEQSHRYNRL